MADLTFTRSIKLKLVIPRSAEEAEIPRTVWATHAAINAACRHYEEHLVLMRGRGYVTKAGSVGEEQVRAALLDCIRAAQRRNRHDGEAVGQDDELAELLGQLYADIVPSAVGEDGDAQAANAFLSPLVDAQSRGFLEVLEKIGDVPNWLAAARDGEADAFDAAFLWLQSEAGNRRLRATGAPAAWMRLAKQMPQASEWVIAFIADFDRKLAEAEGVPTRIRRLRELGVLPLFQPYFRGRVTNADAVVTRWDRLAFRLAVGHLLSWESWCRRAAEDDAKRRSRLERFHATHVTEAISGRLNQLRAYERERQAEIVARGDLPESERAFRIRPRMIRGWRELREVWLKAKSRDQDALVAQIAATQTKLRGRFGDPHLFHWLARPENHQIWDRADDDAISVTAALNAQQDIVDESRSTALLTLPDPVQHPRATQWEAEGGSNFKNYRLQATTKGLRLELPVLKPIADQLYTEQPLHLSPDSPDGFAFCQRRALISGARSASYGGSGGRILTDATGERRNLAFRQRFRGLRACRPDPSGESGLRVAATGQMAELELLRDGNKRLVRYTTSSGERLQAKLGSADLLLDWDHAHHRPIEQVADGDIGPAWLKLALAIEPQLPSGWEARRPAALDHFRTAAGKASKHRQGVRPGLRVLSIDLGVRSFAAASVFELLEQAPVDRLSFPIPDLDLVAVHERSFLLKLPGERSDNATLAWREQVSEELRRLRRGLNRCRSVRQLAGLEGEARHLALGALRDACAGVDPWPFEDELLRELESAASAPLPIWDDRVRALFSHWRATYGQELSTWRQSTRSSSLGKRSGKSVWAIQHLTDVRRTLQSWSLLGRVFGDIRRLNREERGIFAIDLLAHLNGLKTDRIKSGADLIVQAARGYLRDERGRWNQRYEPCQILVFEDLARYRMRTDRPRRENSQLMRWAHRAVLEEVTMQGQLYGLHATDVSAAFSSRYHAATATPGLRCHALTQRDLDDPFMRELLLRETPELDLTQAWPGQLIPLAGGEIFVAPTTNGGLSKLHADLNAAQNLQHRFWSRHGEPFRLTARRVMIKGQPGWVPLRFGERLKGALAGYGMLEPTGHDSGSCTGPRL